MKNLFCLLLFIVMGCASGNGHYDAEGKADILKFLIPKSAAEASRPEQSTGISDGMSKAEVRRLLGNPQEAARYGTDEKWSYTRTTKEDKLETIDVYFEDGRVADWRR